MRSSRPAARKPSKLSPVQIGAAGESPRSLKADRDPLLPGASPRDAWAETNPKEGLTRLQDLRKACFQSPDWLSGEKRIRAERLTSYFENSTLEPQYDYIENIHDGRGYTAGRAG